MDLWPEFVTEGEAAVTTPRATKNLTGWETIVFEVEDDQGCGSDFSTAAIAP